MQQQLAGSGPQPAAARTPRGARRQPTVLAQAAARLGAGEVPARKPVQPASALLAAHPGVPAPRTAAPGAPPAAAALQQQVMGNIVQRLERSWSSGALLEEHAAQAVALVDVQAAAAVAAPPLPPASGPDFDLDGISALLSDLEGLGLELEEAAESSQQIDCSEFTVRGAAAAAVWAGGWHSSPEAHA